MIPSLRASTICTRGAGRTRRAFTLLEILVVIGIIVIVASLVLAVSSSVARAGEIRKTEAALATLNSAVEEYERAIDRAITCYATSIGTEVSGPGEFWDIQQAPLLPPVIAGPTQYTWIGLDTSLFVTPNPYRLIVAPDTPHPVTTPFRRTAHLIDLISKQATAQAILRQLPSDLYRRMQKPGNAPSFATVFLELREVVDAWGNPIVAVFPGREWVPGEGGDPDADGTIRTAGEKPNSDESAGLDVVCRDRKILFISAGPNGKLLEPLPGQTISTIRDDDNIYSYTP